jgi:leucyl/phenylalanyl-tRNA--protein transferase
MADAAGNPASLTKGERLLVREMLSMYREAWFPMGDADGQIDWYRVEDRAIVPLDDRFHVSRSLARLIRRGRFLVTTDTDFSGVIRACATVPRRQEGGQWLHPDIVAIFELMHRAGHAHSIEVRVADDPDSEPVGGIYGLAVGKVFCAESMFCRPEAGGTDASKVALVCLRNLLRHLGFETLDAQIINDHTATFGTFEMPGDSYLNLVRRFGAESSPRWPASGPLDAVIVAGVGG